ncbi:MAG TPA: Spy/CpxP family protein refolding chaperone [Rhodanobacteraceae bacterium]|nr:Spy/CpxP family protein refolding chaperone [Rhodanobacteraceae bacterium]
MRKTYFLSAALVTVLGCAPLAFAQQADHAWHGHHGMAMSGHMYEQLNLSDAQRSQIQQLVKQNFAQAKPQMQALRQARQAFEAAAPGTADYQTAASNLAEAEADAARARTTNRANLRAQIYELLTPAQRTQLASLQAERKAQRQQWRESHMQGGDDPAPDSSAAAQ